MVAGRQAGESPEQPAAGDLSALQPRGSRRLIYTSDPSNLAFYQTGRQLAHRPERAEARNDPARPGDLTQWVDELANNGVDTYAQAVFAQGWTLFFRSDRFEYDSRPQNQRFVEMLDSGRSPLEVLIERTHERGMEFIAKFRMNDRHGDGTQGARFVLENPQWWLEEFHGGLDYSFEPVRELILGIADEVVSRFDVDGLLFNYIRHMHCFPTDVARERQPVMTQFLRSVREMLDRRGREKGKSLSLGVMVPQTLEECLALGYDVPTWVRQGLIDYVCPCDFAYPDFNAPYEQFSELTRSSDCFLYPTLSPLLCRGDDATLLRPESYRALAQNFYGAGADGVTVFNYQYNWARLGGTARYPGPVEGYPLALTYLRDLASRENISRQVRHYRYHPLWGGPCPTGAVKNDRAVLRRQAGAVGEYRFRMSEHLGDGTSARVYFTAQNMLPYDRIRVLVNGKEVDDLQRVYHAEGRLQTFGRPLPPFSTVLLSLEGLPLTGHDNALRVELTECAPGAADDVVIDEVEVLVMPNLRF